MDKEIDRIQKNPETDIVVRIDEYNGKTGVTIREFVKSERYTGFTKAGTRIPADKFHIFKKAINSINEKDLETSNVPSQQSALPTELPKEKQKSPKTKHAEEVEF
jgi:GH25 family lysozyme M1 (1,4-beta-N-acetylmuramidase)